MFIISHVCNITDAGILTRVLTVNHRCPFATTASVLI